MRLSKGSTLVGAAVCVGMANFASGALQVQLHKVNTSVGLLPTNATNKWKLQTDPEIGDPAFATYIPTDGNLSNHFDPTIFELATNPDTGQFALGDSVIGLGAYQVVSFDVPFNDGGVVHVAQNPANPASDLVTTTGDATGGETGDVLNIHFTLIPDRRSLAGPANMDQLFYEINLVSLDENGTTDPGVGTTFPNSNSYLTIAPRNPNDTTDPVITTPFTEINPSTSAPEPASMGVVGLGLLSAFARRRR